MKVGILSLILASAGAIVPVAAQAVTQTYQLDIPRQQLDAALKDLAQQTGLQIARFSDTPEGSALVGPVSGSMPVTDALKTLLAPSRLTYKIVNDHTIAVMTLSAASAAAQSPDTSTPVQTNSLHDGDAQRQEGKKNSSGDFRLAQVDQGTAPGSGAVTRPVQTSSNNQSGGPALTEIIVTAEKRSERLQDVPVPVTAISSETLLENNQTRIQDYFATVPGLNFTADNRGNANLSIRGITTGAGVGNPTVSVTIDDVPFGPSSSYGAGGISIVPDLDPSDLARVEVLRGPQGTLYGASSIGGLIKYVTQDPSVSGFSGRVQINGSDVQNGDGLGFGVRGAVNAPVTDTLAIRASAFVRRDPGYIDNVLTGENGANRVDVYGGRLSGLWSPTDDFSVKLSALLQDSKGYGNPYADPSLGDLKQSFIPYAGTFHEQAQLYSATINAKLGAVDFTSVSGFGVFTVDDTQDLSVYYSTFYTLPDFGVSGTLDREHDETHKFTQEFRFSGQLASRIDWLAGAFYTYESSHAHQFWDAENSSTGQLVPNGNMLDGGWPTTYAEYAAFTDITVHLTDRFDVQFGGRESFNRQTYSEIDGGGYGPVFFGMPGAIVTPEVTTKDNAFTYLVTPRFRLSPDVMAYLRLASGYRPGGPNPTCLPFNVPCHFNPDKTQNYELGIKGQVFDRKLSFDASVYYINWKDIQLQVVSPTGLYFTNASRAKSEGVELSVSANPWTGATVAAWAGWNEAILTEGFPPGSISYGAEGDRLPNSSRGSGSLSFEQSFPVVQDTKGFVGGSISYVGNRIGLFTGSPERQVYPAYAQTDLRTGLTRGGWRLSLAVTNVANKRGELAGGYGTQFPTAFDYIRPRTGWLSLSKSF